MGKLVNLPDNTTEENRTQRRNPMSPNATLSTPPLDLSMKKRQSPFVESISTPIDSAMETTHFEFRQMSIDNSYEYEPPTVYTQPKTEWHYRSIKDLAKKHLPYLAGDGRQRTPIRVTVPRASDVQMYLVTAIRTIDNQFHPSKVIVPAKTHVNKEDISHDNNLDCLRFDECNPADHFDRSTGYIYSEINLAEHQAGFKEVRVHMFNLYQNRSITKDVIEAGRLNQCKLAFWLCVRRNNDVVHVSDVSFSSIIEEKKMSARSRAPAQTDQPTMVDARYAQFLIDNIASVDSDDEDDDDSS